ncbi:DUF4367 domain-containing protein, partial [Anaerovoracaceae bacterium 41-7]
CVVIVCAGTFSAMNLLVPDAAIAGKNGPVTTEEGNNTIVKEGRGEPGENAGEESIIVDDWKKVDGVKKKYPQLLIPQYVPEGYEFEALNVQVTEILEVYAYTFNNKGELLQLSQFVGGNTKMIKNYDRTLELENGSELRIKEDEMKSGYLMDDGVLYTILGNLSDEEFKLIASGLER